VPASLILRRASRAGHRLELGLATAILRQAAEGLDHAHELRDRDGKSVGLVHRDVSPSNLFVTASGVVKVLDFGVAKSQDALARTHTGALKGKYAYMSPEQVLGEPIDRRSDVWALGIVLFELLTAQRLFWRDSEYKMFQAIVDEPIPSLMDRWPGLPAPVAKVAERALSRDVSERFATAREMGEALEEAMAGAGGIWKPSHVADYVAEHFGGLLQERRDEVQAALSGSCQLADLEDSGANGALAADEVQVDLEDDETRARTSERKGRSWLGGLALAAALAGGGLLAYRQWVSSPAASPTPIVVLGGEVETMDGRVTRARAPAPAAPVVAEPRPAVLAGAPTPASGAAVDPAGGRGAVVDPYQAELTRHEAQILRCFSATDTEIEGTPELSVSLKIDRRGVVTRAGLIPAALQSTPVGECLLDVAKRARFGRHKEGVDVAIPLRIRRL
jgi:serine/threonine-protein kinase